jgi:hypothetical protein
VREHSQEHFQGLKLRQVLQARNFLLDNVFFFSGGLMWKKDVVLDAGALNWLLLQPLIDWEVSY